jgi:hypothetical protein
MIHAREVTPARRATYATGMRRKSTSSGKRLGSRSWSKTGMKDTGIEERKFLLVRGQNSTFILIVDLLRG